MVFLIIVEWKVFLRIEKFIGVGNVLVFVSYVYILVCEYSFWVIIVGIIKKGFRRDWFFKVVKEFYIINMIIIN